MSHKTNNMSNLKLSPSLFIKENEVISYDTVVAVIKDGAIYEKGKFSRTTTRHVRIVANLFKLNVISDAKAKIPFHKYEMGEANCRVDNCFSIRTSIKIAQAVSEGSSFLSALSTIPKYPPKDEIVLRRYLNKKGVDLNEFEKIRKFNTVLKHII